jgi:membrane protein involved in colicin uptake
MREQAIKEAEAARRAQEEAARKAQEVAANEERIRLAAERQAREVEAAEESAWREHALWMREQAIKEAEAARRAQEEAARKAQEVAANEERIRLAAERQARERLAANEAHQKAIDTEIIKALFPLAGEATAAIMIALKTGAIPHVRIEY